MKKITILGAGGFGLALAVMCDRIGHDVTVWSAFESEIKSIREDGENKEKLPGIKIPESIKLTTDEKCVSGADMLIVGLPTSFVRSVCERVKPYVCKDTVIVNTSKGLEGTSLKRMSVVLEEIFPCNDIVVLTGPSHAEEVARTDTATTIVAVSKSLEKALMVQEELSNPVLRIYINDDMVGCELGGAFKNVIALCAGILDGMKLGDNSKAALMTRGIHEITRLGVALGGKPETFSGLTGIGDLIVTCTSMHSRNRRAGILIGEGVSPDEAVKRVGTVEGYICAKSAYELSREVGVEMPIVEECYAILYEGKSVKEALNYLMTRPNRIEIQFNFSE